MKKKSIIIGVASALVCASAFVLVQYAQKSNHVVQDMSTTSSTLVQSVDYEAVANNIKSSKEKVIVSQVFPNGYLKKHGNHYHFIEGAPPSDAIYEEDKYTTKVEDNYVFNAKDVVEENEWGYVVKHGDHYHFIYKKQNQTITGRHKTLQDNLTTLSQHSIMSQQSTPRLEQRITDIMAKYGLTRDQIIVNEENQTLIYPHGNHYHYEKIGEEHTHDEHNHSSSDDKVVDDTSVQNQSNQLDTRIMEIMKNYQLKREQIKVDVENNAIIYPHGSHYHYEKIDDTKPMTNYNRHGIKEEYDDGLARTETHKIVGPLAVTSEQLLNKDAIAKAYPNLPIKNMAHYHIVGFLAYPNFRENVGDLVHNGALTEGVIYLVLKNMPWSEVASVINPPQVHAKEGYYFKGWTYDVPTEDIVDYSRIFGAQFRLEKYKNSPIVLGPFVTPDVNGIENIDIHDYTPVNFHSLPNGQFMINGKPSKHAFYLIKQGVTWQEAINNGFSLPQTQSDDAFEFVSFSKDVSQMLNEKVTAQIIWAKFGSTETIIGAYKPSDVNNPLDVNDPKRPHPKDPFLPYDETKYVNIAFVAGDNVQLDTFFEQTKVLTYMVRRGTTWKAIKDSLPQVIADDGYRLNKDSVMPNNDNKIEYDTIYYFKTEKEYSIDTVKQKNNELMQTNTSGDNIADLAHEQLADLSMQEGKQDDGDPSQSNRLNKIQENINDLENNSDVDTQ